MTSEQYKSIVNMTLGNMNAEKRSDSLSTAREILKSCGVPLPSGSISEVVDGLDSGDYMWWQKCTAEEARECANAGTPVVEIDTGRITVVIPDEETSREKALKTRYSNLKSKFVMPSSGITAPERSETLYYAYGNGTTTTTTECFYIEGIPSSPIYVGDEISLIACLGNEAFNSVDATWDYDPNVVCMREQFCYHTFFVYFTAISSGTTTITASYEGRSCSFIIKAVNKMQIYISPANHEKNYVKPDGSDYPVSEWNERKNMEIVAGYLQNYLENYCVCVKVTNIHHENEDYTGRPDEANVWIENKSRGLYLALHSNEGAKGTTGASGSVAYYNNTGGINSLALAFVDAIDPLLPAPSDRSSRTIAGKYTEGTERHKGNLGELRLPECDGIPSVIIENGFHDNPDEAAFLISNQQALAATIGSVLVNYYGLISK